MYCFRKVDKTPIRIRVRKHRNKPEEPETKQQLSNSGCKRTSQLPSDRTKKVVNDDQLANTKAPFQQELQGNDDETCLKTSDHRYIVCGEHMTNNISDDIIAYFV